MTMPDPNDKTETTPSEPTPEPDGIGRWDKVADEDQTLPSAPAPEGTLTDI